MGVGLLFDSTLDRFLEAEGDRPGALWFFQHIPKTAGSSFRGELAERLRPSKNLAVDYRKGEDTLQAQRDAVLEQFLEEAAAGGVMAAPGRCPPTWGGGPHPQSRRKITVASQPNISAMAAVPSP